MLLAHSVVLGIDTIMFILCNFGAIYGIGPILAVINSYHVQKNKQSQQIKLNATTLMLDRLIVHLQRNTCDIVLFWFFSFWLVIIVILWFGVTTISSLFACMLHDVNVFSSIVNSKGKEAAVSKRVSSYGANPIFFNDVKILSFC